MNEAVDETSLHALLAVVEQDREHRCREIDAHAEDEARQVLRRARSEARKLAGTAMAEERRRATRELISARAHVRTLARERAFATTRAALDHAWPKLEDVLRERWADPASRTAWVEHVIAVAQQRLPSGDLVIEHAPGFAEADTLATRLSAELGRPPRLKENAALRAGLCVEAAGALVNGSLGAAGAGLVADRAAIESRLLALLAEER